MFKKCSLCSLDLPKNPLIEAEHAFCCSGCLTVFNIIGAQKNYQTHPVYQEALQAGVISNPKLLEESVEQPGDERVKLHLEVDEMWCPSCAEVIRLILMRQKGIYRCVIDYATDLGVIEYDPCKISKEEIYSRIERLGYSPRSLLSSEKNHISKSLWLRFGVATFCALNMMMFSYPLYAAHFGLHTEGYEITLGWLLFALSLPLITFAASPIWRRLSSTFQTGLFGMETLVFIGVTSAFVASTLNLIRGDPSHLYFDSMAMVLTFVLLGKILEKKAKFSAKETLFRLTRAFPKRGYKRMASGEYVYVPLKEISVGDCIFVRTGEKVVLDGVVVEGEGWVDEAVMTGEATPLKKISGTQVVGGSLLKQGTLHIRVTSTQETSLLGKIVSFIENDLPQKQKKERMVDQITRFFIPLICLLALFLFLLGEPLRALTLLFISCPCAIGIAVPLAQSRLLCRFAEKGALVRNRSILPLLAKDPFFVFDKTGTLTEGKFQVLQGVATLSSDHQKILKGFASYSTHPIASAIGEAIPLSPAALDHVVEIVGRGMEGSWQGERYLLGSEQFFKERGFEVKNYPSTVVYFAKAQTLLAEVHLGDRLRSHLPKIEGGVLSGDSHQLTTKIAKQCGFKWGKGGCDPLQKREEIEKLKQKRPIAMVGDGVNDAPALTAADIGISVVSATDLSVEVSDLLLTTDHLDSLPSLVSLAKRGQQIIYQNLFWAFFYNVIGIGLAFCGLLSPFFAALAMVLSSLCVTLNSLRI